MANGFSVIISDTEFQAFRTDLGPITPSIRTNSMVFDHYWIFQVKSRSLSPLEREREAALQYGLYVVLEAA